MANEDCKLRIAKCKLSIERQWPRECVPPICILQFAFCNLQSTGRGSNQTPFLRTICFSLLCLSLLVATDLAAQDQVILQLDNQSSRMVVPCSIIEYTGEKITVQLKSGVPRKEYPAEQVIEVRTEWLDSHERGRKLLADRKVEDAARALQEALVAEKRAWVRREILSLLVKCALRQGNRATAGTRFLMIVESDPTTRHFGLIPLVWAPEQTDGANKSAARGWLTSEIDVARLLGASWLLDDAQLGETAQQELAALQRGRNEPVRLLAQTQLWRIKLRALDVSDLELQRWDARVRELPSSLRAGPSYLLGRGWAARREHERAATAWLWLPLMDAPDPRLAARAGFEAAESLRRLGQKDDARRLLQDIASRFPDTEFGEAAGRQVKVESGE